MTTRTNAPDSIEPSTLSVSPYPTPTHAPTTAIQPLLDIMASLRAPDGCPWDKKQTYTSLLPYLAEESAEYMDAVVSGNRADMKDELGDVLLQVVFHAEIAREEGAFDFSDVVEGICHKLWTRHPHVFGDADAVHTPEEVERIWAERKAAERMARGDDRDARIARNPVEGVSKGLEPLQRAHAIAKAAARVGFDWDNVEDVALKVHEELGEVLEAHRHGEGDARVEEEVGDLLFAVANLARRLGVRPEAALRQANAKFERRFASIVDAMDAQQRPLGPASRQEMEDAWNAVRRADRDRK